ncbi:hypothetical protein [Nesterenkonia muleiensis]|uniref:hypothetical protein n=1 Tax=Nesterenkonia muleiensis TaxID=2282648 RepID=UPI001300BBE7|nr:hypothetical protein [Nesterenkonia muleiensis]
MAGVSVVTGSMPSAGGSWRVERRLRFSRERRVIEGAPQFGFHTGGHVLIVEFAAGWIGSIEDGEVVWTVGAWDPGLAVTHVQAPFDESRFVAAVTPRTLLVSDAHVVHRIELPSLRVTALVDTTEFGVKELGNCVPAPDGHLWANDILGHQIVELTSEGQLIRRIGDGIAGFQRGTVGCAEARFGWIYDLRCGPDGRLYVLDSTNYAVRVVDPALGTVTTICGDGIPGGRGDGGPASLARLGGDPAADFDGPWSLVVDSDGDVYIGDTHNHAVRRIDAATGLITTIASATSASPPIEGVTDGSTTEGDASRSREPHAPFTKICGLDLNPATGRLLVPDWIDDESDELLVLVRAAT